MRSQATALVLLENKEQLQDDNWATCWRLIRTDHLEGYGAGLGSESDLPLSPFRFRTLNATAFSNLIAILVSRPDLGYPVLAKKIPNPDCSHSASSRCHVISRDAKGT